MKNSISAYVIRKLGFHRGNPRLWIEGGLATKAGFVPAERFNLVLDHLNQTLTLRLDPNGSRVVSSKVRNDCRIPVLDVNNNSLSLFEGLDHIKITSVQGYITIQALDSDKRALERMNRIRTKFESNSSLSTGSLCHGGGVLAKAVHDGLNAAGLTTKLSFASEIREDLLEHAAEKNPIWQADTVAFCAPLQELAFDTEALCKLPQVDILEAGLPCEGASISGRAKNHTTCAEQHPLVGHLVVGFLAIVARTNPVVVLLENVCLYRTSSSMAIIRNQMRDFGYVVHEIEVNSSEWGCLEQRKRFCMVAVSKGIDFDLSKLEVPFIDPGTVGDILDDVPVDDPRWSEYSYLIDKSERDKAAGKGFAMSIVNAKSNKVSVLGFGYAKVRSTESKIQHPFVPKLMRQLTPTEHARCKKVDPILVEGLGITKAHEILGQGITPPPFIAIAKLIGEKLLAHFSNVKDIVLSTPVLKISQATQNLSKIFSTSADLPQQTSLF